MKTRLFRDNIFLAIATPPTEPWYRIEGFFTTKPDAEMVQWFAERGRTLEWTDKNGDGQYFVYMNMPVNDDALMEVKMRWPLDLYDLNPVVPEPVAPKTTSGSLWPDFSSLLSASPAE